MAEYISREAVMLEIDAADFVIDANFEGGATLLYCDDVVDRLSAIPAADVRPVVKARWKPVMLASNPNIQDRDELYGPLFVCDKCNWTMIGESNFCPNCGADMRGES